MIFPHSVYALVLQGGRVHTLQCFVSDPKQATSDCHFVISSFHHLGWEAEGSRGGGGLISIPGGVAHCGFKHVWACCRWYGRSFQCCILGKHAITVITLYHCLPSSWCNPKRCSKDCRHWGEDSLLFPNWSLMVEILGFEQGAPCPAGDPTPSYSPMGV